MMIDLRPRLLPALVAGLGVSLLIGAIHLMSSDLPDIASENRAEPQLTWCGDFALPEPSLRPGQWPRMPAVTESYARERNELHRLIERDRAESHRVETEPPEIQFSLTDPDR